MKRIFLLAIAGFTLAISVNAQREYYGRQVRLGFKLDPVFINTLKPFDNGIEKAGSKFGVNYGLMADVLFSDSRGAFATGSEVSHAAASIKTNNASNGLYGKGNYDLKLQYLQIPLSVKLKTNYLEDSKIRVWGQFGTYVGALIGARMDYNTEDKDGTKFNGDNARVMKNINKANMGLLIGTGIEYNVAPRTDLYLGLGFENGFVDVTSNNKWHDGKVALNRWAFRLGAFF